MSILSTQQQKQFREEAYCVLCGVIDHESLAWLREDCAYFHGYMDAFMDAQKVRTYGLSHRGSRYFISQRYRLSHRLHRFLFGKLMSDVCRATVGDETYLFGEQWVLKGADRGMKFSWHQDAGYVKYRVPGTKVRPYLTCWCALDDVDERNGTVYVLPHSKAGTRETVFDHVEDAETHDLVGYTGDELGVPIIAPAGSIALFSSYNFHRSGGNMTDRMRRGYLAQYTSDRILRPDGLLFGMAVPFLRAGQVVYDPDGDTAERYGPQEAIPGAAKTKPA